MNSTNLKRAVRPRILVVCDRLPEPDKAAGDRRLVDMLGLLAAEFDVDLCILWPADVESYKQSGKSFARLGIALLPWMPKYCDGFSAAVIRHNYSIALFEFFHTFESRGKEFVDAQPWAKTVIDSVDVHFLREAMGLEYGQGSADVVEANKAREIAAYRSVDAVIAITSNDADALRREEGLPDCIAIIPIIVAPTKRNKVGDAPNVLFIGGFRHPPNEDGITWFVEEIWEEVRHNVPQAQLTIIGSYPTSGVAALKSEDNEVNVMGYVPNTQIYLDRAAVSIAPLRFGGGMKGKVCEAMAAGVPVVMTSCGAQGLDIASGCQAFVEDSASGFARALIDLLQDRQRAEKVGLAGQDFITALCSPEEVGRNLNAFMNSLLPDTNEAPGILPRIVAFYKYLALSFLRWHKHRLYLRLQRGSSVEP